MARLKYTGTRTKDFTTVAEGESRYVSPGQHITVTEAQAAELLALQPPQWERIDSPPAKHAGRVEVKPAAKDEPEG